MTTSQRHYIMSHIRSFDTRPEQIVRHELWRRGYRYRKCVRNLPGTPDIVLPKYHTVIFVNGCFWHGHDGCFKYTIPKTNPDFWKNKIAKNKERDLTNTLRLESIGWSVITLWECELKKSNLENTIKRLEEKLDENLLVWENYRRKRRIDRQFAMEQAKRKREINAILEAELYAEHHIPQRIRRLSKSDL